jgi:hypothetical protein
VKKKKFEVIKGSKESCLALFHAVEFALALQDVCNFFVTCASFNLDAVLCGHEVIDVYTAAFDACKFLWSGY